MEIVLGTYAYALIMFFISIVFFFVIEKSSAQAILMLILLMFTITFFQSCSKQEPECDLDKIIAQTCNKNHDNEACVKEVIDILSFSCDIDKI